MVSWLVVSWFVSQLVSSLIGLLVCLLFDFFNWFVYIGYFSWLVGLLDGWLVGFQLILLGGY